MTDNAQTQEIPTMTTVQPATETTAATTATALTLFPYQKDHVTILHEILQKYPFALDLSMLGTGKTYTSAQIGLDLKVKHIVVIAPVSVKSKWRHMQATYKIPLSACISFCELRSTKCHQPKHGLLARRDYTVQIVVQRVPKTVHKVEFTTTTAFKTMVQEGVLLIIDEVQNIKNISAQSLACQAMIAEITNNNLQNASRLLLVSGSPIDKMEQAVHMFRCLGIMKSDELCSYNVYQGTYTNRGIREIETYCRALGDSGIYVPHTSPNGATACVKYAYKLFQAYFKMRLSHAMDPPVIDSELNKMNGIFNIVRPEDQELLAEGIKKLQSACSFNPETHTVNFGHNGAQAVMAITAALIMIETAKLHTFVRIAKAALMSNPNKKVVICVNYSATINDLKMALAEYDPLILQGAMNSKQREVAVNNFQEGNTTHRLLIANLSVCSTGIDLDDKFGFFPREVFVSPMYNTITLYQLCHRFQRMDTKSSCDIYMVYGKNAKESNILTAIGRKSNVMKETTENQVDAGVEFPGDYATYEEEALDEE